MSLHEIPKAVGRKIEKNYDAPNVRNASCRAASIVGTIELVQIGKSTKIVNFIVVEKLTTSVVLGSDFCEFHVETIKTRLMVIEMDS